MSASTRWSPVTSIDNGSCAKKYAWTRYERGTGCRGLRGGADVREPEVRPGQMHVVVLAAPKPTVPHPTGYLEGQFTM